MALPLCWRACLPCVGTWRKPHRRTQIFKNGQSPTSHSCFLFLLFPDLDHDLKPFLMPKLQVHDIKSCHLPTRAPFLNVPRVLHQLEHSGIHLELDRAKWSQDSKAAPQCPQHVNMSALLTSPPSSTLTLMGPDSSISHSFCPGLCSLL